MEPGARGGGGEAFERDVRLLVLVEGRYYSGASHPKEPGTLDRDTERDPLAASPSAQPPPTHSQPGRTAPSITWQESRNKCVAVLNQRVHRQAHLPALFAAEPFRAEIFHHFIIGGRFATTLGKLCGKKNTVRFPPPPSPPPSSCPRPRHLHPPPYPPPSALGKRKKNTTQ